jgi:hypothetical protein
MIINGAEIARFLISVFFTDVIQPVASSISGNDV